MRGVRSNPAVHSQGTDGFLAGKRRIANRGTATVAILATEGPTTRAPRLAERCPRRDTESVSLDRPVWVEREALDRFRRGSLGDVVLKGLWVAGDLAALGRPCIAVVGSRAPSEAGRARARAFGATLAQAGACIVSGLALGIDAAAHEGALEAGGATIGVLGGGHRVFFPRRNRPLARAMLAAGGAVVSPFGPDEPARPWQFLQRNGVIAALVDAVVVVEAAARSGSLNTASWAAARSTPVFAVPGDVDRAKAAGCNALLRDGATLVRDAADVIADLGLGAAEVGLPGLGISGPDFRKRASAERGSARASAERAAADRRPALALLPELDTALAEGIEMQLAAEPLTFDALADGLTRASETSAGAGRAGPVTAGALLATLTLLELHGFVRRNDDGRFASTSNEVRR